MHLRYVYKHYRFLSQGGVNLKETDHWEGRHGRAFHYQRGRTKGWSPSERGGYTLCYLKLGDEIVAQGVAECSKKDHFCYADGRSLALRRVLEGAFMLPGWTWSQLGVREVT